jgi:hypothetical protein
MKIIKLLIMQLYPFYSFTRPYIVLSVLFSKTTNFSYLHLHKIVLGIIKRLLLLTWML